MEESNGFLLDLCSVCGVDRCCKLEYRCSKSLQVSLCKLCFAATVSHIWKQINDSCHGNTPRTEEAIVAQIKWEVRLRIMAKGTVKRTAHNVNLAHSWNLHPLL
jgi:hypothetical protein